MAGALRSWPPAARHASDVSRAAPDALAWREARGAVTGLVAFAHGDPRRDVIGRVAYPMTGRPPLGGTRTHVALLRAMNVGKDRSVSTADLRSLLEELGHGSVASYLQSGNFVFASPTPDPVAIARRFDEAVMARHGVAFDAVVLKAAELAAVVGQNPYPDEQDPRHLHAVLRQHDPPPEVRDGIALAVERARARGSTDEATLVGRTLYLRTPGGMGRSELAAQLARALRPGRGYELGTARNWATVTKLVELLAA